MPPCAGSSPSWPLPRCSRRLRRAPRRRRGRRRTAAQPKPRAPRVGGPVRSAVAGAGTPPADAARALARPAGRARAAAASRAAAAAKPIELLRSYDIPRDDPSYDRLLNWSWTYDSAVAAAAFAAVGERRQSTRLLDQLAALQRTDGAIEPGVQRQHGETARRLRVRHRRVARPGRASPTTRRSTATATATPRSAPPASSSRSSAPAAWSPAGRTCRGSRPSTTSSRTR